MKKVQRIVYITIMSLLLLSGCENKEIEMDEPPKTEVNSSDNPDTELGGTDKDTEGQNEESEELMVDMTIYYVDMETAEITTRTIEWVPLNPETVWKCLQEEKLLTEKCGFNNFLYDKENETIDIDVNQEFGNYIRSMGTTGESQIIECVTKSYLETYDCGKIKITEDGQVLQTGHAVLEGYISYE